MILCRLEVRGLRILREVGLDPVPGLNLIRGANGAGKTSLLEAIHLLGTGHSFRSRQLAHLLPDGADSLQVTGRIQREPGVAPCPVGIRKSRTETLIRIHGRSVSTLAELARQLPLQVIHPESHALIGGPPGHRRAFLDWGAFHRDVGFQAVWQRYRHLLHQRNAALRTRVDARELSAWEGPLALAGEALDAARTCYVDALSTVLSEMSDLWPEAAGLSFEYRRGWPADLALAEALARGRHRDRDAGFTQYGPHRAELSWRLDGRPLAQVASRGQQKFLVMVLKLAQARLLATELAQAPVVLVDDLPSELDGTRLGQVMDLLRRLGGQVFVTAIDGDPALFGEGWDSVRMFHVEHGEVSTVAVSDPR